MGALCGKNSKKEDAIETKYLEPFTDPYFTPINKTQLGLDFFKTLFTINIDRYVITEHKVKTDDGYILTVFRVNLIDELKDKLETKHKKDHTVLLSSAFRCSTDIWFQGNDTQSFGGYLVNEGYDVWCQNIRGLKYSIDHEDPNISAKDFYNYSYVDTITKDYPAFMKYIIDYKKLEETGEKMTHIGFMDSNFFLPTMLSMNGSLEKYRYMAKYFERAICTILIIDWDKLQDKACRNWEMDNATFKGLKKKAEELGCYNWASTWPGSSKSWLKLKEYLLEEFGWADYSNLMDLFKHDAEEDNYTKIVEGRFCGKFFCEGQSLQSLNEMIENMDSFKNVKYVTMGKNTEEENLKTYGTVDAQMMKYDLYDIPTHIMTTGQNIDTNHTQNTIFKERSHPDIKLKEHCLPEYNLARMFFGKNRKELREMLDVIMLNDI